MCLQLQAVCVAAHAWTFFGVAQDGRTALHLAALENNDDAIRFLLSRGASTDVMDNVMHPLLSNTRGNFPSGLTCPRAVAPGPFLQDGRSAIHLATSMNAVEAMMALIQGGSSPDGLVTTDHVCLTSRCLCFSTTFDSCDARALHGCVWRCIRRVRGTSALHKLLTGIYRTCCACRPVGHLYTSLQFKGRRKQRSCCSSTARQSMARPLRCACQPLPSNALVIVASLGCAVDASDTVDACLRSRSRRRRRCTWRPTAATLRLRNCSSARAPACP